MAIHMYKLKSFIKAKVSEIDFDTIIQICVLSGIIIMSWTSEPSNAVHILRTLSVYFLAEIFKIVLVLRNKQLDKEIEYRKQKLAEEIKPIKNKIIDGFHTFFVGSNDNHPYLSQLGLTDMQLLFEHKQFVLVVTLNCPGLFIGTYGSTIDAFKIYLERITGHDIKIEIQEPTFLKKQK